MAPLIRARIQRTSFSRIAAQSPNLTALAHNTSSVLLASHRGPAATTSPSRCFWWGRHGYRNKYSSGTAAYHKCLEAQSRIAKSKAAKDPLPLHRFSYPIYYSHGHGWRLASSWGKPKEGSNEFPSDKSKSEGDREREWKNETEKWQEELNTYLERLRKRVESHPYETLFGASTKHGVWNPWGVDWDNWMRNLGWKDPAGGKFGTAKGASQEQSAWGAAAQDPKEWQESKQSGASPSSKNTSGEIGDIDLITLRRIQKDTPATAATNDNSGDSTQYDIPVKKFGVSGTGQKPAASPVKATKPLATPPKTWLAKEGFSEVVRNKSMGDVCDKENNKSAPTTTGTRNPRLESSLERHLRTVGPPTWEPNRPRSALSYNPEENKTEDIDLLRASDVRAAAGHLKRPSQEAEEAREQRRKSLQARFVLGRQEVDEILAREVQRAVTNGQSQSEKAPVDSATRKHSRSEKEVDGKHQGNSLVFEGLNLNKISSEENPPANVDAWGHDLTPKGLETAYQDELDNKIQSLENYYARQQQELIEAEEQWMAKKRKAADAALVEEIKAQKAAMMALEDRQSGGRQTRKDDTPVPSGEGDVSSKVSDFASTERWSKRKAPHAVRQDEQKANDARLVREIRQIYEERYGNINTQHRQPNGALAMEGNEDTAVQEGLRAYDEMTASGDVSSGLGAQVSLTDLEQSAVREGLREYDEKLAAEDSSISTSGSTILPDLEDKAVQEGLRKYDEKMAREEKILRTTGRPELEDPAVQAGLRDYDEKIAAKEGTVGPVQEGLRDYDEKITAQEDIVGGSTADQHGPLEYDEKIAAQDIERGVNDAVQEGLRDYDEKMAAQENTLGLTDTVASSEMENRAVQDGLREFDEKASLEAMTPPTKGRIASTDLDSQEIALLGAHKCRDSKAKSQPNPYLTSKNNSPKKVQPATSTYKVLAYDPTTDSIATATTTSSLHESLSAPRSASSILTHLENPAKYFDHFEPLEAAGYELVAGSRRALIFKKVREDDRSDLKAIHARFDKSLDTAPPSVASDLSNAKIPEQAKEQLKPYETFQKHIKGGKVDSIQTRGERPKERRPSPVNTIDWTTVNTESSTATHSTIDASTTPSTSTPASSDTSPLSTPQRNTPIRREEEVFSGHNIIHEQRRERKRQRRLITLALRDQETREDFRRTRQRVWRFVKRFIWNGAWVAGCFYLVGALLEEVYRPRKRLEAAAEEKDKVKGDGIRTTYEYYDVSV
ncbi:hypothetical protein MMC30_002154 [Trapelia coarctata]|nr:hypothetical protein [Trapelia coarctata]